MKKRMLWAVSALLTIAPCHCTLRADTCEEVFESIETLVEEGDLEAAWAQYEVWRVTDPDAIRIEEDQDGYIRLENWPLDLEDLLNLFESFHCEVDPDAVERIGERDYRLPDPFDQLYPPLPDTNSSEELADEAFDYHLHMWGRNLDPTIGDLVINPDWVSGGQAVRQFDRAQHRRHMQKQQDFDDRMVRQRGIAACEDKCHIAISALEVAIAALPGGVGALARVLTLAGVETARWTCIHCCRTGNFYGQCIFPVWEEVRYHEGLLRKYGKQALQDIGRGRDPMWDDDDDWN